MSRSPQREPDLEADSVLEATERDSVGEVEADSVLALLKQRENLKAALYDSNTPPLLVLNEASARGLDLKVLTCADVC